MPILIQELIAADSISQAVDKINFNFDQILLNGGGPVGPPGPLGPPGPIGGRGVRGTQWYEDSLPYPGQVPSLDTNIIVGDLLPDDNYLQANGDVWTWSGLTWTLTQVNLTGPVGPAGSSGAWLKFGADVSNPTGSLTNSIYPEPFSPANGANNQNEGVSTVVVGGIVTQTPPIGGINQTLSLIPNPIAKDINSDFTSMFIHQKSSLSKAIVFHGGADGTNSEYFEQESLANLVYMGLGADDSFSIVVPKFPTNPDSNLIGLTIQTERTSQVYSAGKEIIFTTGNDPIDTGSDDTDASSNFTVIARQIPNRPGAQINLLSTTSLGIQAKIQIGGPPSDIPPPQLVNPTQNIVIDARYTHIYAAFTARIQASNISVTAANNINITAADGILELVSPVDGINLIGFTNVTGAMYVTSSAVVNGDLITNSNLQVDQDTNIEGTLTVGGVTTLNNNLVLNSVPNGSISTEVLVRNPGDNVVSAALGTVMPIGGIIMWNGEANTVPTGWKLCDGTEYELESGITIQTPDLRSRFVVGAGTAATLSNPRVKRINYNKFTMRNGENIGGTQGTWNTLYQTGFSQTSFYTFKAAGGDPALTTFPSINGKVFGRWDGYSANPVTGCNNPPRFYYYVEMENAGPNYTEKVERIDAQYNYDTNTGSDTFSGFMSTYTGGRTVLDGQRNMMPYMYLDDSRRFAWIFHMPSREYRLYYFPFALQQGNSSGTTGPWPAPIAYYCAVLLTRTVGENGSTNINNPYEKWGTTDGISGTPRIRDPRVGPAWGTWAWWDKYYLNGIRIDLPSKAYGMIQWSYEDSDTYQVGESGGNMRHSISRTQMPQHMHGTMGESYLASGAWPNSLFGAIGGDANEGSKGNLDNDNYMYNSASAGGGGEVEALPPYYALSYIMYLGGLAQ